MKIGILVPHLFAQTAILARVIFAPIHLAVDLADQLTTDQNNQVFLFTPGTVKTKATNINTDLSYLEAELQRQGCSLETMISETPLAFVSLARQINTQLTAECFAFAKREKLDVLHVFICEDESPLYYADLIDVPMVFTHHDPYNFYRKYRARFPLLKNLNYISLSLAQQETAPAGMNFIDNVYNGLKLADYQFKAEPDDYYAFLGRIVRVKGAHDAIAAAKASGSVLKIAGKHYSEGGVAGEDYWSKFIAPEIDDQQIYYQGFLKPPGETGLFLGQAKALLFPSRWDEPFGMVVIEALACGTPVIAYRSGAIAEIVEEGKNGFLVDSVAELTEVLRTNKVATIDRAYCRQSVGQKFTVEKMASGYFQSYLQATQGKRAKGN